MNIYCFSSLSRVSEPLAYVVASNLTSANKIYAAAGSPGADFLPTNFIIGEVAENGEITFQVAWFTNGQSNYYELPVQPGNNFYINFHIVSIGKLQMS